MTRIVGTRYVQKLTRIDKGKPWRLLEEREAFELHATKGWRRAGGARRVVSLGRRVTHRELHEANGTGFKYQNGVGKRRTNAFGIQPLQVRP